MDILSIGNSFSQDTQRYLHSIAKADGYNLNAYNLYIGGCPLSRHYRNMLSELRIYSLEMNGVNTGFKVSLREALLNRDWDVVTLQQASYNSMCYESYQPYLNKLVEFIRECVPGAKIVIHQTWAYEQGSQKLEQTGYSEHTRMFDDLKECYAKAFKETKADMMIPSGELFQKLIVSGIEKVHRDSFHASLGVGRYALGLLWYNFLTGKSVENNDFCDFDEEISKEEIQIVKKCVKEICGN